ncbi:uncharacterized protein DUF255 [Peribacillus frigoritolerans]|nr:uncharacterized protein DUF255 [Peribacillus frigoritolerans]
MFREKKVTRFVNEQNPYQLQHTYNPTDWYLWGEEAFEKAKRENKPILGQSEIFILFF